MIDLRTPLSLRTSFAFPLQTGEGRREVLLGAVWLVFVPGVGWLINMGHRIAFVRRMQRGLAPFPVFRDPGRSAREVHGELLRDGALTFVAMLWYHAPALVLLAAGAALGRGGLVGAGVVAFLAATFLVPGFMTHYCKTGDFASTLDPRVALARVRAGGSAYLHAWAITTCALGASFVGLLAFGVGFALTSVWFWQVAGFSFATVFSQRFGLVEGGEAAVTGRPA